LQRPEPAHLNAIICRLCHARAQRKFALKDLTPEHFQRLISKEIAIDATYQNLIVEAVDLLKSPSPRGRPFSLTLRAPAGKTGSQGIARLVHPELGSLRLFLVPLESKNGSVRFEAVFNWSSPFRAHGLAGHGLAGHGLAGHGFVGHELADFGA